MVSGGSLCWGAGGSAPASGSPEGVRSPPLGNGAASCLDDLCRRSALHPAKGASAHPWNRLAGIPSPAPRIGSRLRASSPVKKPYVPQAGTASSAIGESLLLLLTPRHAVGATAGGRGEVIATPSADDPATRGRPLRFGAFEIWDVRGKEGSLPERGRLRLEAAGRASGLSAKKRLRWS